MPSESDHADDDAQPPPATRLAEFATDPLWVVGPDGGFRRVNGPFRDLVGYDRAALHETAMGDLLHDTDADEFAHRVDLLAAEGGDGVETWRGRVVAASGIEIPVELS